MSKLFLLNTTILSTPESAKKGTVSFERLTNDQAREFHRSFQGADLEVVSAIGHSSSVEIFNTLLGADIKENRAQIFLEAGDFALCMKLKSRPPEGAILSKEQLEEIGYEWILLKRIA
jgi:hypothetical protein